VGWYLMQVWLDNLMIRVNRLAQTTGSRTPALVFNRASVWLTNVTMQGDAGKSYALHPFENSRVFAQGAACDAAALPFNIMPPVTS
jgi:hypothetical protein